MKYILLIPIFVIASCLHMRKPPDEIYVTWMSEIEGDFSFTDKWSYQEGIYINSFNQLKCDGFCPDRCYEMTDTNGKITEDSLASFYQIIDTSHQFHTFKSFY